MYLVILFYQLITVLMVQAGQKGTTISCVCTTNHCLEQQITRCNTTGMCFSQYLDRRDGSHPVVKGCIASKTPLLCENRKPAIAEGSWPVLLCCDSNLCNKDVVPTPSALDEEQLHSETGSDITVEEKPLDGFIFPMPAETVGEDSKNDLTLRDSNSGNLFPKIISPVYIAVLVLGVVSLIIVAIVATIVLRRSSKFYSEQYGALERNEDCFKTSSSGNNTDGTTCQHPQHFAYQESSPKT